MVSPQLAHGGSIGHAWKIDRESVANPQVICREFRKHIGDSEIDRTSTGNP